MDAAHHNFNGSTPLRPAVPFAWFAEETGSCQVIDLGQSKCERILLIFLGRVALALFLYVDCKE
jgi:hypothetical protein